MAQALKIIPAEHGEIRTLVDRAADTLARAVMAADVLDARDQAAFAYDASKAAARLLKAKGAHDDVVSAIFRTQADALEIEALAKRRLADEYDAARDRGEVAGHGGGRNFKVADDNVEIPSVADIGLTRPQIFEARQIRDAVQQDPDIIKRFLDEKRAAGIEATKADLKRVIAPPKANLRAAIGTASASKDDRGDNFYQTPDVATRTLLAFERFTSTVWEPACGYGAISRVFEEAGYDVRLSDLVDRGTTDRNGELQIVGSFLTTTAGEGDGPDIVTNPPYGELLNDFVAHALRTHRPRKMAMLLNLNFLCGFKDDARSFVMDENPPARVYVFKRRLPMMHREGWEGPKASSRMNTAWFVWERQADGTYGSETAMRRVDWMEHADKGSLRPGFSGSFGLASFVADDEDFSRTTPRMTLDERAAEARERAQAWIAGRSDVTRRELRQQIGVRDSVAAVLIDECVSRGVLGLPDNGGVHTVLRPESEAA